MRSAAEALEIFEEEDGIVAVEKAAAGIEEQIGTQAGWEAEWASANDLLFGCV